MARIFLTKVWGFSPEDYPALGFNTEGGRRKFMKESEPGDWVALAGTRGAPTRPEYRGRLLGKVQLGPEEINVEETLRSIGTTIPDDQYTEDGSYRWPFGLPMISAYRFLARPDLAGLFGGYLPGTQWASYALDLGKALGDEAVRRVEALETEAAAIVEVPAIVRQRERQRALVLNRSTGPTGPGPSDFRSGSSRDAGAASAYMLALKGGRRSVFKIGYSGNTEARLSSLNKGLLSTVTGYAWQLVARQQFAFEDEAYRFEQALHARLVPHRVEGEQETYEIGHRELEAVWADVFVRAEWAVSGKNAAV